MTVCCWPVLDSVCLAAHPTPTYKNPAGSTTVVSSTCTVDITSINGSGHLDAVCVIQYIILNSVAHRVWV